MTWPDHTIWSTMQAKRWIITFKFEHWRNHSLGRYRVGRARRFPSWWKTKGWCRRGDSVAGLLPVHVVCNKVQVEEPKCIDIAGKTRMLGKLLRYDMLIARPKKVYATFRENRQSSLSLSLSKNMNPIVVPSCVQTVGIPRTDDSSPRVYRKQEMWLRVEGQCHL